MVKGINISAAAVSKLKMVKRIQERKEVFIREIVQKGV